MAPTFFHVDRPAKQGMNGAGAVFALTQNWLLGQDIYLYPIRTYIRAGIAHITRCSIHMVQFPFSRRSRIDWRGTAAG